MDDILGRPRDSEPVILLCAKAIRAKYESFAFTTGSVSSRPHQESPRREVARRTRPMARGGTHLIRRFQTIEEYEGTPQDAGKAER